MFIHMTAMTFVPQNLPQALQKIAMRLSPEACQPIAGLRQWHLIESQDEPGKVIWLAMWDDRASAQAFLTGLQYAGFVSDIRQELRVGPQWYGYSLIYSSVKEFV